ncbi:hypothetical protein XBKQ1_1090004 [Xenorhabdus bovienii str. kraussei Quebec]|uniref:Uncharacterized protein n=1 Tax=Xenorhabdus bovienii str. kraussei Quebec TaxID=1398203 RepID=A0A077PBZ0_XENBV|nr:hypothetical protein XBKQ1_1090004 [Xenorhabdus bovienii str. kraussei Quebec]
MLMIYFLYYSESFFSHIYPSTLKYADNPLFRIINQNGHLLWRNVCDYNF